MDTNVMTSAQHLTFYFENNAEEAPRIARQVEQYLQKNKISEPIVNKILLCVDELFTNIITHAYHDKLDHAVLLECRIFENRLELELRDDGVPFDPTSQNRPNINQPIDQRNIGGLGIHLIQMLMDKVEYKREGDFNVLIVTKFLNN